MPLPSLLAHGRCTCWIQLCFGAGVEWLIAKYKCYMMMRERLVMDTPQLRDKLTSAKPGAGECCPFQWSQSHAGMLQLDVCYLDDVPSCIMPGLKS